MKISRAPVFLAALFCVLHVSASRADGARVTRGNLASVGGKTQTVPPNARITLVPRRADYFLGENIIADFRVENAGETPFTVSVGGDYRGGTRADRFKISARDAQGNLVADPRPNETNFGGLGGSIPVPPSGNWTQTLSLLPYLRFETPGEYEITARHDLGWHATPEHPLPVARATIRLQMPTPEQARQIVEQAEALPKYENVLNGRRNPREWANFSALHYPVYLPILAPKIRAGDARTLPSVAQLETPEATRFLIELLDAKPEIARQSAQYLTARLPINDADPMIPPTLAGDPTIVAVVKARRERVERSWRPEFAAPALDYARRALKSDDREMLRLGAHLMLNLGMAPDYPQVIAALNRRLERTIATPRWHFVGDGRDDNDGWQLQNDSQELMRAARQIGLRDAATPRGGATAADIAIEIWRMKTDEARLELAWSNRAAPLLRHRVPLIRQLALESLTPPYDLKSRPLVRQPIALAPAVRAALPALLADPDISVRVAAVELAGASRDRTLASDVLKNLAQTRNSWDVAPANRAAYELGLSVRGAQIWANRLEQPKMFRLAIDSLIELTTGRGLSGYGTRDAEQGAVFLPRWREFLHANSAALDAGRLFPRDKLPRELYPAKWSL